jgi:hypothetical protein
MPAREIAISAPISRERRARRDAIAKRASFAAPNERNGPKLASPARLAPEGPARRRPEIARRLGWHAGCWSGPQRIFLARFIQ